MKKPIISDDRITKIIIAETLMPEAREAITPEEGRLLCIEVCELRDAARRCLSYAGHPNPSEGCRLMLAELIAVLEASK